MTIMYFIAYCVLISVANTTRLMSTDTDTTFPCILNFFVDDNLLDINIDGTHLNLEALHPRVTSIRKEFSWRLKEGSAVYIQGQNKRGKGGILGTIMCNKRGVIKTLNTGADWYCNNDKPGRVDMNNNTESGISDNELFNKNAKWIWSSDQSIGSIATCFVIIPVF